MKFIGQQRERKARDEMEQWIANNQKICLFGAEPLLLQNHKDPVKDHSHITWKYRGAAHNKRNFKLRLNAKPVPIPVVFHNLKGYDGHLLMQAMLRVQGEINSIPNNTVKYISFSVGNLRSIDSVNFLLSSLDSLVKGSDPQSFKISEKRYKDEGKRTLLLMKGIYPYEYVDCFERFVETKLPVKAALTKPGANQIRDQITDQITDRIRDRITKKKFKIQNFVEQISLE